MGIFRPGLKTDEQKTFKELIAYAKKHAIELDRILFYKMDLAARNLFDYVELVWMESEFDLPFFSVMHPTENTPSDRMQLRRLANSTLSSNQSM